MKKFIFRYEGILKLRQEREDQVKQELAQLFLSLERQEEEIRQIRMRNRQFRGVVEQSMLGNERYPLGDIDPGNRFYRERIEQSLQRLQDIRDQIVQKQLELQDAVKDRKVMETLKENRKREYVEALHKLDEMAIEEIVNYNNAKGEKDGR
ncbi:MAG: hypothetical protein Q4A52_05845 [Bacillota bacterium]|nr:hypothetical protein [Bacillota bacterium]